MGCPRATPTVKMGEPQCWVGGSGITSNDSQVAASGLHLDCSLRRGTLCGRFRNLIGKNRGQGKTGTDGRFPALSRPNGPEVAVPMRSRMASFSGSVRMWSPEAVREYAKAIE